ncbi:hypothetical protein NMY22_g2185 [Coprinellus aureogranulatus]|nr:hypothetical protein NMY22_g2185 [Coprinellus aureogranulatus]
MDPIREILASAGVLQPSKPNLARLLRCNDAPTDAEKERCVSRISALEGKMKGIIAKIETTRDTGSKLPILSSLFDFKRKVQLFRLGKLHRKHKGYLSVVRKVPVVVWQRIFFFVAFPDEAAYQGGGSQFRHGREESRDLRRILRVSRLWHRAAMNFPLLWSCLPREYTEFNGELGVHHIPNLTKFRIIQWYLSLSKNESVGFHLSTLFQVIEFPEKHDDGPMRMHSVPPADNHEAAVRSLELLFTHSPRWGHAHLRLHIDVAARILPWVTGRVSRLVSLRLTLMLQADDGGGRFFHCFSTAPALRAAQIRQMTVGKSSSSRDTVYVEVDLPWSQLLHYESNTQPGPLCQQISHNALLQLGTLKWTPAGANIRSEICKEFGGVGKITLPTLHTFEFFPLGPDHLPYLVFLRLPSLTHLAVEAPGRYYCPDDFNIGYAVASLLQQSECSLTSLKLLLREEEDTFWFFSDICRLSPCLRTLTVGARSIGMLSALSPNNPTPEPVLPLLQTLIVTDDRSGLVPVYSYDLAVVLKAALDSRSALCHPSADRWFELHFDGFSDFFCTNRDKCDHLILQLFYATRQVPGAKMDQDTDIPMLEEAYKAALHSVIYLVLILNRLSWLEEWLADDPKCNPKWTRIQEKLENDMKCFEEVYTRFGKLHKFTPMFTVIVHDTFLFQSNSLIVDEFQGHGGTRTLAHVEPRESVQGFHGNIEETLVFGSCPALGPTDFEQLEANFARRQGRRGHGLSMEVPSSGRNKSVGHLS